VVCDRRPEEVEYPAALIARSRPLLNEFDVCIESHT